MIFYLLSEAFFYRPKMASTGEGLDDWVKLNVGGEKFNTTMSTLLKKESMLSKICSNSTPKNIDEKGYILIDRSGKHFKTILDYLRNGIPPILQNEREAKELGMEADFYCIEDLKKHCERYGFPKKVIIYATYYENQLGEPCSIPLLPDGTMSYPYLQHLFKQEEVRALHAIYWKSCDGRMEQKDLVIQDEKIFPPESGWFARPEWAFDGPYYHLSKAKKTPKINDFKW